MNILNELTAAISTALKVIVSNKYQGIGVLPQHLQSRPIKHGRTEFK